MPTTRREFLRIGTYAGCTLLFACGSREEPAAHRPAGKRPKTDGQHPPGSVRPNAWLALQRDGTVRFWLAKSEMGQGVRTALAMIVAEELDVALGAIRIQQAATTGFFSQSPILNTESSASVLKGWQPLRQAAAAARELMVGAAAALWEVPTARCRTEAGAVIDDRTGRRAGYGELLERAATLPVPTAPRLKDAREFRLLGRPTRRLEGPELVTGRETFSLDFRRPGLLFAVVARPPTFGGSLRGFDATAAERVPGVRRVVPIRAGVAVVGETTWAAMRGRELLQVEWEPGPHAAFDSAAFERAATAALAGPALAFREEGDVEGALAAGARRFEASYATGFQTHAALEPPNATVEIRDGRCQIWCGTQWPHEAQRRAARRLKLAPGRVTVQPLRMGGAFGRKEIVDFVDEAVDVAAAVGGGPVQLVWTREDDLAYGRFHPASRHRLAAAADRRGALTAWRHLVASPSIQRQWARRRHERQRPVIEAAGAIQMAYRIPNVRVDYAAVDCPVPLGYWRGIQNHFNVFAVESFVDELAHGLGRDPLELRRELLGRPRTIEERNRAVDLGRLRPTLELAAERAGWGTPLPARRGRGIAGLVFDGQTFCAVAAEVALTDRWFRVERVVVALDCGRVINPLGLAAQAESAVVWALSAMGSEITFERGLTAQSNYVDFPLLSLPETPAIEVHAVESEAAPSGTGEIPVPVVAPAVANAVFAAGGPRLRRLPVRREDFA